MLVLCGPTVRILIQSMICSSTTYRITYGNTIVHKEILGYFSFLSNVAFDTFGKNNGHKTFQDFIAL